MNKRAQVTIFVLLGLVLLFFVGFGISKMSSFERAETTGQANAQEIQLYVEGCLYETTKDALLLAGRQGGSISLEGKTFNQEQPWLGDTYVSGPQHVPYWYHVTSCPEQPAGCIEFTPPPLCRPGECIINGTYSDAPTSIQEEMEAYIQRELSACLRNFTTLEQRFSITPAYNQISSRIVFTQEEVTSGVYLPLTILDEQTGEELFIEQFSTSLDVDFEELYRLARSIVALEYQTQFVEENFLHFLAVYQGDAPKLPPFNEQEFFGGVKFWLRTDVEQKLETEVLPYLNFMQILNAQKGYAPVTQYDVPTNDPGIAFVQGLFSYGQIVLNDTMYPDLGVSFTYPYSPIYLNINNKEVLKGEQIQTDNIFMKLAGLFFTKYEHQYDVAFPLLVTLEAPDAFGGEGYTFQFALEANILNNIPRSSSIQLSSITSGSGATLDLSNPEHHTQTQLRVLVLDNYTKNPLVNAQVYYECGWQFQAGLTDNQGMWSGTLPYCAHGGILRAENGLDHYPAALAYNNDGQDATHTALLELWPYVQKQITVKTIPPQSPGYATCAAQSCAQQLKWDVPITQTLRFINDTLVPSNETCELVNEETGEAYIDPATGAPYVCEERRVTTTNSEYALVMINRQTQGLVTDPSPLLSTLTFGQDAQEVALASAVGIADLNQLLANATITQEEYDVLAAQVTQGNPIQVTLAQTQTVDLIPGAYSLQTMLVHKDPITIPAAKKKVKTGLFSKKTIHLPPVELPSWVKGGSSFTGANTITFTPDQVYGNNQLVLYALEQPLPVSWGLLEEHQSIEQYQQGKESLVLPRFE